MTRLRRRGHPTTQPHVAGTGWLDARMRILMYHDVVPDGSAPEAVGFPGAGSLRYKLDRDAFLEHVAALAAFHAADPAVLARAPAEPPRAEQWSLTFDDGGSSALASAHDLAARGWRAHFFITTARIGSAGFLGTDEVAAIHRMGHVVGTHTASHPAHMSKLSTSRLLAEWSESVAELSALTGSDVRTGSVPGGDYSPAVARAAAAAGIDVLFTSRPTDRPRLVDGMLVIGRFPVRRHTPAKTVVAVTTGARGPWLREQASWAGGELAKRLARDRYPAIRRAVLETRAHNGASHG